VRDGRMSYSNYSQFQIHDGKSFDCKRCISPTDFPVHHPIAPML